MGLVVRTQCRLFRLRGSLHSCISAVRIPGADSVSLSAYGYGTRTLPQGQTKGRCSLQKANKWIVFVLVVLCYGLPSYAGFVIAGRAQGVMETLGLSTSQFSALSTAPMLLVAIMTLDGFLAGNMMAFFFSAEAMLPGIGPRYAGTAGGLLSTTILIASVVLPTYVYAPMAGDNYSLLFILFGGGLVLSGLSTVLVPVSEMGREAEEAAVSHT